MIAEVEDEAQLTFVDNLEAELEVEAIDPVLILYYKA